MKPYIQAKNGMPGNVIFYAAYQGFMEMGSECVLFHDYEELDTSCRGDVVVGGVVTDVGKMLTNCKGDIYFFK